ncbi:hypothetical protein IV203_017874 [Nitzschia inconspicua]|uniref:Uncharacterized protein n=1 Tax=Nitzschia inconspicua TaxID=303405 RepID=A0A9K3M0M7_9STRA|nr:hypothetical protein IV203_017874 [Nitzschia inconspicua]
MNPPILSDRCNSIPKSEAEHRTISFDNPARTAIGMGKVDVPRLDLFMVNGKKRELRRSTQLLGQYRSTSSAFYSSDDVSRQPVKPDISPTNSTTSETSTLKKGATNQQSRGRQRSSFFFSSSKPKITSCNQESSTRLFSTVSKKTPSCYGKQVFKVGCAW